MEFRALGHLAALRDGDVVDLGSPKQKALLALLLILGYVAYTAWLFLQGQVPEGGA